MLLKALKKVKLCCDYLTFLFFFKPLDQDQDSESGSKRPLNPDPKQGCEDNKQESQR